METTNENRRDAAPSILMIEGQLLSDLPAQFHTATRARIPQLLGIAVFIVLSFGIGTAGIAQSPVEPFAAKLLNVNQLPRLRPVLRVGSFSSYDRTGGNDDGFSGRYSFLRKEGDGPTQSAHPLALSTAKR